MPASAKTDDSDAIVKSIKARLKERFGLDHATVEIERGVCADVRQLRDQGMNETPLISVEDLSVDFRSGERVTHAVKHVSFDIGHAETVALVGESGSGKTVTALSILKLLPYPSASHPSGKILFNGANLLSLPQASLRKIRGNKISMIFQEPMTSLNPLHTIENQVGEVLKIHRGLSDRAARERVLDLLEEGGHRRSGRAAQILSASAFRRTAAKSDDRHGARQRARPADRRRADHRARRDDPGADPRPAAQAQGRVQHGHAADHPRSRHRAQDGRPGLRHEQRRDRRAGHDA